MILRGSQRWPERLRRLGQQQEPCLLPAQQELYLLPAEPELYLLPTEQGQVPEAIPLPAQPGQEAELIPLSAQQQLCLLPAVPEQDKEALIPGKKISGNTADRSPGYRIPGRETG